MMTNAVFSIAEPAAVSTYLYSWRMVSSGILRRVALVRTDISEEPRASFIRVTIIGELGTTLAVTISVRRLLVTASVVPSSPILVNLMKEALSSSETSVLTRAKQRNIPEDTILHSHRRENLKSYCSSWWQMLCLLLPKLRLFRLTFTLLHDDKRCAFCYWGRNTYYYLTLCLSSC
jgi:hypothetical protein